MINVETLAEILALEPIELNLFRGYSPQAGPARIFGGQVIAQALTAAYETTADRICHSLHCYFIRPGDPSVPILFEVDRSRDGTSFTTRRVTAIQHGKQIFNLAASFQVVETGFEHQSPMPLATPVDQAAPIESVRPAPPPGASADVFRSWRAPDAIELLHAEPEGFAGAAHSASQFWMRARAPIGDTARAHQAALAYASDMALLGTSMIQHGVTWQTPGLQFASLDHALWFHRPIDFNQWHLYAQDSPSASGGRGFARGQLFTQDGVLVASVAQEGLIRRRE